MQQMFRYVFILIFFSLLFLPLLSIAIDIRMDNNIINEKRLKAQKPVWDNDKIDYIKKYYKFFKDNFAGREHLISFYNNFKYNLLNESTVPDRILFGKDDFLFYSKQNDGDSIMDYQGLIKLDSDKLKSIRLGLLDFNKWLSERNIKFYFIIAPDKQTVYPDKMPDNIRRCFITSTDQILNEIDDRNIKIIDLREDLINARSMKYELYAKSDTHWNSLGAYIAYKKIMEVIYRDFNIIKPIRINLNQFEFVSRTDIKDLYDMLGVKGFLPTKYAMINLPSLFSVVSKYDKDLVTSSGYNKLRVIMFRDSFTDALQPFLSNTFGYINYKWTYKIDKGIILKEKPDIVIFEVVERNFKNLEFDF